MSTTWDNVQSFLTNGAADWATSLAVASDTLARIKVTALSVSACALLAGCALFPPTEAAVKKQIPDVFSLGETVYFHSSRSCFFGEFQLKQATKVEPERFERTEAIVQNLSPNDNNSIELAHAVPLFFKEQSFFEVMDRLASVDVLGTVLGEVLSYAQDCMSKKDDREDFRRKQLYMSIMGDKSLNTAIYISKSGYKNIYIYGTQNVYAFGVGI